MTPWQQITCCNNRMRGVVRRPRGVRSASMAHRGRPNRGLVFPELIWIAAGCCCTGFGCTAFCLLLLVVLREFSCGNCGAREAYFQRFERMAAARLSTEAAKQPIRDGAGAARSRQQQDRRAAAWRASRARESTQSCVCARPWLAFACRSASGLERANLSV